MATGEPKVLIDTGDSKLWIYENYTQDLYPQLQNLPLLVEPPLGKMYGKQSYQRRNIGFFSDESAGYQYSGQIIESQPLSSVPILQQLLPAVNQSLGTTFNGILVNSYINGEKYLSAHSDDENGLDKNGRKMVCSIAYGPGVRTFRIREIQRDENGKRMKTADPIVLDYVHKPCTLLVMEGEFQKKFTHEIPVQKRVTGERISLTFRHHIK